MITVVTPSGFRRFDNDQKINYLLHLADRAPSTHNVQPWLFRIDRQTIEVWANSTLKLPEGDPTGRDLHISIGCCVENLTTAAAYYGVLRSTALLPAGPKGPLAVVKLQLERPIKGQTDLASVVRAIPNRFNARGIFKDRPLPLEFIKRLSQLPTGRGVRIHLVQSKPDRSRLAELTARGLIAAYHRPAFRAEIAGWIRTNLSWRRDGIPGRSLRLPWLLSLVFPTLMRRKDIGERLAKLNRGSLISAPAIGVITAKMNQPLAWLECGRLAEKVFLEATAAGLRPSIFVAAVEIGQLYRKVQEVIGSPDRPQFLFALGFIDTPQQPTPRRPLQRKMKL